MEDGEIEGEVGDLSDSPEVLDTQKRQRRGRRSRKREERPPDRDVFDRSRMQYQEGYLAGLSAARSRLRDRR